MAWEIRDEWINLAEARHYVVFHNKDVLVASDKTGKPMPVEHHLVHDFKLKACPHCGVAKAIEGEAIDFQKTKHATLAALKTHHGTMMDYRAKHPHVRIGNGPK